MNLTKVNKKISLPKEVWVLLKEGMNKVKKVDDEINIALGNMGKKWTTIKFQGAIASKTLIDPEITEGRKFIVLDLVIEFEKPESFFTEERVEQIKEVIKKTMIKIYGISIDGTEKMEVVFKEKEKSLEFNVILKDGKHQLTVGFDFILMETDEKENKMLNLRKGGFISTDPISLTDSFNGITTAWIKKYGEDFDPRTVVKVIRALEYKIIGEEVIKRVTLMSLLAEFYSSDGKRINWKNAINALIDGANKMEEDGEIINFGNNEIKIFKGKNFDHKKIISFLEQIKTLDEKEILKIVSK